MPKLTRFVGASGNISVNPDHVVTVRPSADEKGKTIIFLVTGGQIVVDGTVEEVTGKLSSA